MSRLKDLKFITARVIHKFCFGIQMNSDFETNRTFVLTICLISDN